MVIMANENALYTVSLVIFKGQEISSSFFFLDLYRAVGRLNRFARVGIDWAAAVDENTAAWPKPTFFRHPLRLIFFQSAVILFNTLGLITCLMFWKKERFESMWNPDLIVHLNNTYSFQSFPLPWGASNYYCLQFVLLCIIKNFSINKQ